VKQINKSRGGIGLRYFLSIDCGLTKIKVNIFAADGSLIAEEQADTPLENFLVNTIELKRNIVNLIKNILLKSKIEPEDIKTISTSGHGNGAYFLGEDGIFKYGFSSMFPDSASYTPPTDKVFDLINQTSWSGQPLPILSFLKKEKPETFKKIKKILFCKDVIKYFLTGRLITEYTDASAGGLLNYKTSQYDKALMKCYGLEDSMHLLPDISHSMDVIGTVSEKFAHESGLSMKTKVLGGMFDVNACMLGAGVVSSDKYCIIGGTWGINSAVLKNYISSKHITQCCNFLHPYSYMCIDSAPTSCTNLEWFLKNVLKENNYKTADRIVQTQDFDEKLLYLPYIYAASDVNASGSFIGLNPNHTYKDMLRAVYEGIVFEHMRRIEKMKNAGIVFDTAVLTGGAANGDVLCQMFADVTDLKIQTVCQSQTGSLGGAIIGTVADGIYSNVEEAVEKMVRYKKCYHPTQNSPYTSKYKLFKETINHTIS
jgi:L-xylulokinase